MGGSPPSVSLPMVFAVAAGLVLIAVPLYLRSEAPRASARAYRDAAALPPVPVEKGPTLEPGLLSSAVPPTEAVRSSALPSPVKISRFETIRCVKASPGRTVPERCEHLHFFEQALTQAIRDHADLGPSTLRGATVSFVMDIDFRTRRVEVFRGKSSTVPKADTKELFRKVRDAMPHPPWHSIRHDHYRYVVYVKATYPPSKTF